MNLNLFQSFFSSPYRFILCINHLKNINFLDKNQGRSQMFGTLINCITDVFGTLGGLLIGKYFSEEMKSITIKGIGLIKIVLGI